MTLRDRIKSAMAKKNVRKACELAAAVGVRPATVSLWLNGQTKSLEGENLTRAAGFLGVNAHWLATGEGKRYRDVEEESAAQKVGYVRIEQLDVAASGGAGAALNDFPEVIGELSVLESWARQKFGSTDSKNVKIISCRGDSMAPTIQNGDIIFVDISAATFAGEGIYVFIYQDRLLIKRLRYARGGGLAIHSDNRAAYEVEYVPASEVDQVHICGQVVVWWTTRSY